MSESDVGYRVTRRLKIWFCIILLGVASTLHQTSALEGDISSEKCPDGTPAYVRCGRFNVPLDYSEPRREQLSLWFAIINGTVEGTKQEALIALPGGPGFSASRSLLPASISNPIVTNQPTVILDTRGTGFSQALFCSLQNNISEFFSGGGDPELVAKCAYELGPRRIYFNSANTARDVEVLRQKLSISRWNLIGISYGNQAVTFYASLFPGSARTITLDSPFPLGKPDRGGAYYKAVLRTLRAVCDRNSTCSAEEVLEDLSEVLADLRKSPREKISPQKLQTIFGLLAADRRTTTALAEAKNGDYNALETLSSQLENFPPSGIQSLGTYSVALSITTICLETRLVWQSDACKCKQLSKYERLILNSKPGEFAPFSNQEWIKSAFQESLCTGVPPLPSGVRYRDLVPRPRGIIDTKGTPVFVVSGELDLLTPPNAGIQAASQFNNRVFSLIANTGHVVLGRSLCGRSLISEFIVSGRFPQNTSRCADPATQPVAPDTFQTLSSA